MDSALNYIQQASGRNDANGIVADAGTADGCKTIIQSLPEVDILVNNLGIYGSRPFFEIDDAAWEEIFQVNVMSGVRLARHYAKSMQCGFNPSQCHHRRGTAGGGRHRREYCLIRQSWLGLGAFH